MTFKNLVYEHFHILWTYQEAWIKERPLDNFWPDCVALGLMCIPGTTQVTQDTT